LQGNSGLENTKFFCQIFTYEFEGSHQSPA